MNPRTSYTKDDQATPPETEASDRAWQLACQVVDLARGLLISDNPFLSSSVGLLAPQPADLDEAFACDGKSMYVCAQKVLANFSRTRTAPVHDLAHVLIHCLLLHPFVDASVDAQAWDLASDIVAESIAAELLGEREDERGPRIDAVLDQLTRDFSGQITTERLYRALKDGSYANARGQWAPLFHVDSHGLWPCAAPAQGTGKAAGGAGDGAAGGGAGSPAAQASAAAGGESGDGAAGSKAGSTDGAGAQQAADAGQDGDSRQPDDAQAPWSSDHDGGTSDDDHAQSTHDNEQDAHSPMGPRDPQPLGAAQRAQAQKAWERAAKSMRVDLETISRTRGAGLGNLVRELSVGTHERIDYREFLRQFAVEHEDMRLSDDEFDYIFYTYGLELYENVPLIEPLEYRSEKRIRDFAIVIDTSSSVSAKVVQEFVDATFDVLNSEGGFFAQTNIHIIQADARVQSDIKITSPAELNQWRHNIKLYGFGGTDFRPAFRYVQELRQAGEFDDLQGLVYFTDGWGIYPDRMPPYKCAFVFYDEDHRPELVPAWAIQVVLHPGEFESMSVY